MHKRYKKYKNTHMQDKIMIRCSISYAIKRMDTKGAIQWTVIEIMIADN